MPCRAQEGWFTVKPVSGFLLQVGQGKELPQPIAPYWCGAVQPDAYYVAHVVDGKATTIVGGPYTTEERAFGAVSAITDTSGT